MRLLVVEDERDLASLIRDALRKGVLRPTL